MPGYLGADWMHQVPGKTYTRLFRYPLDLGQESAVWGEYLDSADAVRPSVFHVDYINSTCIINRNSRWPIELAVAGSLSSLLGDEVTVGVEFLDPVVKFAYLRVPTKKGQVSRAFLLCYSPPKFLGCSAPSRLTVPWQSPWLTYNN